MSTTEQTIYSTATAEPNTPCPECGSNKWVMEMGESLNLRHYRGCSQWTQYFDGGLPSVDRYEGMSCTMPSYVYITTPEAAMIEGTVLQSGGRHIPKTPIEGKWAGSPSVLRPGTRVVILAYDPECTEVPARMACWVKAWPTGGEYTCYRSCELSDLQLDAHDHDRLWENRQ